MNRRSARIVGILALLSAPSVVLAQQNRIPGPVDRLRTVRLRGNIHPKANPQFDAGPVDPAMKLDHVMVMLKRSAAQQADLDQLLAEQQDRSSRNYHAWLTPEQFGNRFGLSPNDVAQVVSWLQSEGLAVDEVSRARNWIWFSGSAARMQAALRTQIRRYRVDGELHFANADEPSVPAAIEPLVIGIQGLDDFHPPRGPIARVPLPKRECPKLSGSSVYELSGQSLSGAGRFCDYLQPLAALQCRLRRLGPEDRCRRTVCRGSGGYSDIS